LISFRNYIIVLIVASFQALRRDTTSLILLVVHIDKKNMECLDHRDASKEKVDERNNPWSHILSSDVSSYSNTPRIPS
jgi:hypothetical protein